MSNRDTTVFDAMATLQERGGMAMINFELAASYFQRGATEDRSRCALSSNT